ncbi:MAG: M24 family metallopeptidase [Gammaproteobacteria bacterium]
MAPPFPPEEYADRLHRTRAAMQKRELDVMVIGDPANINWLTGYDAWSFYTPQLLLVPLDDEPIWFGREMDAGAASFTTYLKPEQLLPFPEHLVQKEGVHPTELLGDTMKSRGFGGRVFGYESDVYYFSPRALFSLQSRLPDAKWIDADLLVNWVRVIKSPAEIEVMQQAGIIANVTMQTVFDRLQPGQRQCDLMAEALAAQIRGTPQFGGDMTALYPLVLAGEAASTAHPMWTDAPFEHDQTVAFELGGCRKRYNAGLARTAHLGKPPQRLIDTAKAVEEGLEAVLDTLKAGVPCSDVHAAWQRVLERHGLEKKSRIGYSIGVGYAPDWGEHTLSFRPGETIVAPENAVVHIILGMWMEGWGMELSETIHVREHDCVCLTDFPRSVHIVA